MGAHGLSLRDPAGALLRVVPLEHVTSWGRSKDSDCVCQILVSQDLQTFHKLYIRMLSAADVAAICEALASVGEKRAEEVRERESAASARRSSRASFSLDRITRRSRRSTTSSATGDRSPSVAAVSASAQASASASG